MKQTLISLFLLSILLMVGCSEKSSITAPENVVDNNYVQTTAKIIPIPAPVSNKLEKVSFAFGIINGYKGGSLKLDKSYYSGRYNKVSVEAELNFKANAFRGIKYFFMAINDQDGSATFYPHAVFNIPVIFNLTIEGMDLSSVSNPNSIKFVYVNEDGTLEPIVTESITVELSAGKISVRGAQLPHFSRYAFVGE